VKVYWGRALPFKFFTSLPLHVVFLCAFGVALSAHPVPFSYLDLRIDGQAIQGTLVAHIEDVAHDLSLPTPQTLLDPAVVRARAGAIVTLLSSRIVLTADGRTLVPEWSTSVEPLTDRQSVRLTFRIAGAAPFGRLVVRTVLFPYDANHRTFVNVYDAGAVAQYILEAARPEAEYFAGTRQGAMAAARKFVGSGVHHILIGPDHLLFLVGLLLLGGSVRRLALVVTGFTIAHSITLTLAALNILSPPPGLIEPAIALSIVCIGADNLLVASAQGAQQHRRDLRAWMAFVFGFIHGFGFANVLREMDLPARVLGWSLFSFNLGVEIGQLAVVLPVAVLMAAIWSRSAATGRRVAQAGSLLVAAAGVFWFVERVFWR
jgi:hydrogenase/urease accessory protein HupE